MADLLGKVAVITGGATGIGLATARKFVAGAHAFIFGRRNAEQDTVTEEHFDRHFDINVKGTVFILQRAFHCSVSAPPSS